MTTKSEMPNSSKEHFVGVRRNIRWPKDSKIRAKFSGKHDCYRNWLTEIWDKTKPVILWILMNPSTADLKSSDSTLCRTGKFSREWGYGTQVIMNVHDYRATDNKRLLTVDKPMSDNNILQIVAAAHKADKVIIAFGNPSPKLRKASLELLQALLMNHIDLHYLELSKDVFIPKHPLYLRKIVKPLPYRFTLEQINEELEKYVG